MELRIKPSRVSIYVNSRAKSIAQVKSETGCAAVINGGVFNNDWTPGCWLKADGLLLASEPWLAWGFGWDTNQVNMQLNADKVENFINCVALVRDGEKEDLIYPDDMGGARQRTAWAIMPDGSHLLYCDKTGLTPEALQDYFYRLGAQHALMLDGGGSTQCIFPGGSVNSTRPVQNLICFWGEKEESDMPDTFAEPTALLRKGAKGKDVLWLQLKLNECGYLLDADGDFGTGTYNAVVKFQDATNLTVDGVVGENTRAMLKRVAGYRVSDNALIAEAAKHVGVVEPTEDDAFITEYNRLANTTFGLSAAWCQMFVVVMQKRVGGEPYVTASCTAARTHYKAKKLWGTEPIPGDLIYFDWDLSGDCDHVGVVVGVEGDTVFTIEGNAGGRGPDGVRVKQYKKSDARIAGYASINSAKVPQTDKPCGIYFASEAEAERFVQELKAKGFTGAFYRILD